MVTLQDKKAISFNEFIDWYPETTENLYELRREASVTEPKPKGKHSEIAGFVIQKLNALMEQRAGT